MLVHILGYGRIGDDTNTETIGYHGLNNLHVLRLHSHIGRDSMLGKKIVQALFAYWIPARKESGGILPNPGAGCADCAKVDVP